MSSPAAGIALPNFHEIILFDAHKGCNEPSLNSPLAVSKTSWKSKFTLMVWVPGKRFGPHFEAASISLVVLSRLLEVRHTIRSQFVPPAGSMKSKMSLPEISLRTPIVFKFRN